MAGQIDHAQAQVDGVLQEDAREVAGATTISSCPFRHEAACSREEPQPKFLPPTMTLPGGNLLGLELGVERGLVREGELRRLGGQHGGHEAARIDDVGGDVVADFENDLVAMSSFACLWLWDR